MLPLSLIPFSSIKSFALFEYSMPPYTLWYKFYYIAEIKSMQLFSKHLKEIRGVRHGNENTALNEGDEVTFRTPVEGG